MISVRLLFRALWAYRGFVAGSIAREFQSRYRNSMLGAAWTFLNPLAQILVYTIIFAEVMHARLPGASSQFAFSIYLCAGILPWTLFTEIINRNTTVFIDNSALLKKVSFPRICLPIVALGGAVLNFAIIMAIFLTFLVLSGNFPGWPVLAALPVLALLIAFAVGLGMLLGVLNVFFRDVAQLIGIVLQFWFWFTPIVYARSILPAYVQAHVDWNPMAPIIGAFQDIFVKGQWPQWPGLVPACVVALLLCFWALRLFRARMGEMVDEL